MTAPGNTVNIRVLLTNGPATVTGLRKVEAGLASLGPAAEKSAAQSTVALGLIEKAVRGPMVGIREIRTGFTGVGPASKLGAGQATGSLALIDRASVGTVAAVGKVDAALAGMGPAAARSATQAATSMGLIARTSKTLKNESFMSASKASTGVLAIGAAAVYGAVEWEKQMTLLQTATGETASNIKLVSDGLLNLGATTGAPVKKLAEGMFYAEKAGYRGAAGINVMKAAAQGASGEGADLAIVTKALTTVMTTYNIPASQAATAMSKLERAAGLSKTSVQSFSDSLGTVLPIAYTAGLSFEEVGAAIATLTSHGTSARAATFDLGNMFRNLQVPLGPAQKLMQQLGIDSLDLSKNLGKRGLAGTMDIVMQAIGRSSSDGMVMLDSFKRSKMAGQDLRVMFNHMPAPVKALSSHLLDGSITMKKYMTASNKLPPQQAVMARQFRTLYAQSNGFNDSIKAGGPAALTTAAALKTMFGGQVGLRTALMLTGTSAEAFADRTANIGTQVMDANGNVSTWHETMGTAATKLGMLKGELSKTGVAIGTDLLPALLAVAHFFQRSVAWVGRNKDLALSIIEVAAGFKILRLAMMLLTKGNPLLLLISAVAVGLIYLYNHSQKFRDIVNGVFKAVGVAAKFTWDNILKPVFNFITGMFTGIGKAASWVWDNVLHPVFKTIGEAWPVIAGGIKMAWEGTIKPALDEFGKFFSWINRQYIQPFWKVIQTLWGGIAGFFKNIGKNISDTVGTVKKVLSDIWDAITGFFNKKLPGAVTSAVALHDPGYMVGMIGSGAISNGPPQRQFTAGDGGGAGGHPATRFAGGGKIVGPGGPKDDKVPLWGSNGEYMVNAASTAKYRPLLDHINADKYAKGGLIGAADQISGKTTGMIYGKVADVVAQNKWVKMSALFGSGGSQFTAALRVAGAAMAATGAATGAPTKGAPATGVPSTNGAPVGKYPAEVMRWTSLALKSLQLVGESSAVLGDVLYRINLESTGNPNAINNWDSNAKKGTPSQGLVQVIQPTFDKFALPGYNTKLMDPMSNLLAGERWSQHAYGSVHAGFSRTGGYDQGGWLQPGGRGQNNLRKPEAVLTPEESRGLKAGGSIGGSSTMTIERLEINIHGGGDPHAIGEEVERRFRALTENLLNSENDRSY